MPNDVYYRWIKRYRRDPVAFVREVLGVEPDPWQAEILQLIADGERRISVRSGHGVGKSACASWALLWFLATRYPCKAVVTSPTASQLFDALFVELKMWAGRLPERVKALYLVKSDRVELTADPQSAFISARTSRAEQPDALQGVHSENVLLVVDEASGVPEAVFQAASGSMSGHSATTLLLGNPVRASGFFYETHHRLRDTWKTYHVSCLDSDRVSEEYVREQAALYGDESNVYRVRVLGEFPIADDDAVIPLGLVLDSIGRDVGPVRGPVIWGLDVARFGSNKSCLCKRRINHVLEPPRTWAGLDLMQLTGQVKHEWDETGDSLRPEEIMVDAIGLGAGVADRLQELGLPAVAVNVAELPALATKYANLRAELWYEARSWFEARDTLIPDDQRLVQQLTAPTYQFTSGGKLKVESKDSMKKRGMPSPDIADAFVLTFASAAGRASGRGGWGRKGEPLSRYTVTV